MPSAEIPTATLAMPGGELANLLRESPTFAPQINAGLAAQGVSQGTTLYEQFFRDAQTAVDSGDPVNFIAQATALHPIHLIQVVGGGSFAAGPGGAELGDAAADRGLQLRTGRAHAHPGTGGPRAGAECRRLPRLRKLRRR